MLYLDKISYLFLHNLLILKKMKNANPSAGRFYEEQLPTESEAYCMFKLHYSLQELHDLNYEGVKRLPKAKSIGFVLNYQQSF